MSMITELDSEWGKEKERGLLGALQELERRYEGRVHAVMMDGTIDRNESGASRGQYKQTTPRYRLAGVSRVRRYRRDCQFATCCREI